MTIMYHGRETILYHVNALKQMTADLLLPTTPSKVFLTVNFCLVRGASWRMTTNVLWLHASSQTT
jgi:hypothetical protein